MEERPQHQGVVFALAAGLVLALAAGCGTAGGPDAVYGGADARARSESFGAGAPSTAALVAGPAPDDAGARMIVRSGSIDVVVPELEAAADALSDEVDRLGGYVSDTTATEEWVQLTARVPSDRLDPFLDVAAGLGEVERRSVSGADVTEVYSDLRAEIDNLAALRDRLRTLLDKARTVEEVLDVERELTRVQTRLDALNSRRERLEKDVALSAVAVRLSKESEREIRGPVQLLVDGVAWFAKKLWVISP